jgi:hypothetical protein
MSIKVIGLAVVASLSTLLVGCIDEPIGGAAYTGTGERQADITPDRPIDTSNGITSYEANYCRNAEDELACLEGVEAANDQ